MPLKQIDPEHAPVLPAPQVERAGGRQLPDHPAARRDLVSLQRLAGNAAVAALIQSVQRAGPAPVVAPPAPVESPADIHAYETAKAQHDTNRATLKKFLDKGFAQKKDRMLKNSTEWVSSGKIKIFPLTPTHDSAARAAAAGSPHGAAYFSYPAGDLLSPAVYYARKKATDAAYDNTNVSIQDSQDVDGFQSAGEIAIMQSAIDKGRHYFWSVLMHETQHAADFHGAGDLEGYKTEFRAYWLGSREYNAASPSKIVHRKGYAWSERQYAIFKNLYTSDDYKYVKDAWDAEAALPKANRDFRKAVVAFRRPESINRSNSIRVDDFYRKLTATAQADCDADTAAAPNANVAALRASAAALNGADRGDMKGNAEITKAMDAHLKGAVRTEIDKVLAK